jgi:hypothetical protein
MTTKPTDNHEPFTDDINFLEAEGSYVIARSARMDAERRIADDRKDGRRKDTIGHKPSTASKEWERKAVALIDAEDRLRQELDQRIEATKASSKSLGLDALCGEFNLGMVERTTLLLATLVALDERYEDCLREVGCSGFGVQVMPELVFGYLELDFAARIEARAVYMPTAPLLKSNLVTITMGRDASPYELRSASIQITQAAFNRILGVADIGRSRGRK